LDRIDENCKMEKRKIGYHYNFLTKLVAVF
jgi:hypothetical protein